MPRPLLSSEGESFCTGFALAEPVLCLLIGEREGSPGLLLDAGGLDSSNTWEIIHNVRITCNNSDSAAMLIW